MMTKRSLALGLLISMLSVSVVALPARAQGRGRGNGNAGKHETSDVQKTKPHKENHARKGRPDAVVIDQDGHRRIVQEFYSSESLPPGLAKRESLPPGLAKQLRERGQLPPGLQKRLTPLPPTLQSRLPAVPSYYTRYFAGRDLIVVDRRTNRIVSIIRDIRP